MTNRDLTIYNFVAIPFLIAVYYFPAKSQVSANVTSYIPIARQRDSNFERNVYYRCDLTELRLTVFLVITSFADDKITLLERIVASLIRFSLLSSLIGVLFVTLVFLTPDTLTV